MNKNKLKIIFIMLCLTLNFISLPYENVTAYGMDTSLTNVDASFLGESSYEYLGQFVSSAGDVNSDGYDDLLINAYGYEFGGPTYLIFGRTDGWLMDVNIINKADAVFKSNKIYTGQISGVGDINNDGYDDILIGGGSNSSGQCWLFFGKNKGWIKNTNLSNADVSFIGKPGDNAGYSIAGAGDVNGDGFDDILIGAYNYSFKTGKTYLIFGKETGWSKIINLSNSDASFIGENGGDKSGFSIAGGGDVNGDGLNDILIGAYQNSDGGKMAGKIYLIFGKPKGWSLNTSLSNSDASFYGKMDFDRAGKIVSGAGDVNNDGYDDFLIFSDRNDNGSWYGSVYLIFGKDSNWKKDIDLKTIKNASFIAENTGDFGGGGGPKCSMSGARDTNGDGYDDFIISAPAYDGSETNLGKTYLILGKKNGWELNTSLANSNASFVGENNGDFSGVSISGSGDVNGDGYDDILIGAHFNDEGGTSVGQTYLIFPEKNTRPTSINSVTLCADNTYTSEIDQGDIGWDIYVKLIGTDGDSERMNVAEVIVNSSITDIHGIKLRLRETNNNSGIYRGNFKIANLSHESHSWIGASGGETITVYAVKDPNKFDTLLVKASGIKIIPFQDNTTAIEDTHYKQKYSCVGVSEDLATWLYNSNASWLNWGTENHTLYGIPTNDDVGQYWVRINISYNNKLFDEHNFTLTVININDPPEIIGAPTELEINALEDYELDLSDYIFDVDNSSSDLKLIEDSAYANVQDFSIIFNYSNSVSFEQVRITATDGIDLSNDHIINVTVIPKDTVLPTIIEKSPTGNNVSISINISVLFSKPMNFTSIENAFSISPNIVGHNLWSFNKTQVYCECNSNLKYNQTYTISITSSARDLSGNPLDGNNNCVFDGSPLDDYSWSFTTALIQNLAPLIKIDFPLNNSVFNVNDTIYFDCANTTDLEGDILEFLWKSNISGILSTEPKFSIYLPIGHHQITLFVNDGHGHNVSAFVNIIVIPFNRPPIAIIDSPKDNDVYNITDLIHFNGSSSIDPDGDILNFYWHSNISGGFGFTSKFSSGLPAGHHQITLFVIDGFYHNVSVSINITVLDGTTGPANGGSLKPPPTETDTNVLSRAGIFGLIVAVIVIIILTGFVTATEIGKYGFLGQLIPLYSRLKGKKVLDHETRGMIRGYIIANPGDHFNSIKRNLKLKNGALTYHLKVLEREELIKSRRDGIYKRFFPIEERVPENITHLTKIQESILNEIIEKPGITQKGLGTKIKVSHQVINYHIKKLISANLIRAERFGKKTKYYVFDEND